MCAANFVDKELYGTNTGMDEMAAGNCDLPIQQNRWLIEGRNAALGLL